MFVVPCSIANESKIERKMATHSNDRPSEDVPVIDEDETKKLLGAGLELSPELMAELAHKVTELLIERKQNLPDLHAWDGEFREELENHLLKPPPEKGDDPVKVLERAAHDILSIAGRTDHPRFFGFVPSSPTWPGILADYLASGFHVNQATWLSASGASQLELVVMDWIRQWLGYPEGAGGLLTSGGSAANLIGLVAAREAAGQPDGQVVYMSDQTHSAIIRAALIMGVKKENIRSIASDSKFRIDMDALTQSLAEDRSAGLNPIAVAANAGSTSTGSIDPLNEIADFCEEQEIWMHVDGAFGGFAAVTPRGKQALNGIERADSICLDAHKWFFQPYEVGCLIAKDVATLENAFAIRHDILQDTIWGKDHPNFSDRGLQLSRSVRALKIWLSVQVFGMEAFRNAILNGMMFADRAAKWIEASSTLELLSHESLSVVCFRVNPKNSNLDEIALKEINHGVLVRIFWDDPAFFSSTLVHGKYSLRLCIINHTTTWRDVSETLEAIERFGQEILEQRFPAKER